MEPLARPRVGSLMNVISISHAFIYPGPFLFVILLDDSNRFLVMFGGTCRRARSNLKLPTHYYIYSVNNFNYAVFYM
jgi:hypothetical protein